MDPSLNFPGHLKSSHSQWQCVPVYSYVLHLIMNASDKIIIIIIITPTRRRSNRAQTDMAIQLSGRLLRKAPPFLMYSTVNPSNTCSTCGNPWMTSSSTVCEDESHRPGRRAPLLYRNWLYGAHNKPLSLAVGCSFTFTPSEGISGAKGREHIISVRAPLFITPVAAPYVEL